MKQKNFSKSIFFFGLIILAGFFALYINPFFPYAKLNPPPNYPKPQLPKSIVVDKNPSVKIGQTEIPVEIARTNAEVQKGLSGRKYLDRASGLLFIFSKPDIYRFWMPDMNFPIDIIWIADDKVAGIEESVSNDFNPTNPKFYTPPSPVKYVLEVNARFSKNNKIRIGDLVVFNYVE